MLQDDDDGDDGEAFEFDANDIDDDDFTITDAVRLCCVCGPEIMLTHSHDAGVHDAGGEDAADSHHSRR